MVLQLLMGGLVEHLKVQDEAPVTVRALDVRMAKAERAAAHIVVDNVELEGDVAEVVAGCDHGATPPATQASVAISVWMTVREIPETNEEHPEKAIVYKAIVYEESAHPRQVPDPGEPPSLNLLCELSRSS
jgi:hypothetical protein